MERVPGVHLAQNQIRPISAVVYLIRQVDTAWGLTAKIPCGVSTISGGVVRLYRRHGFLY